ncbi:predicted protein [Chaetoceros tenuissimus]|uniref:Uncharacterized protein n=1 Tax=Chaetoceros tenuissimus TaxID=426638 RepID=A0AAD3HB74_9STRA|nr:predicted protein [Chaetoceros tenuissimus]
MCYKCDEWRCSGNDEIQECIKDYRFGFLIGGAIVFFLSIIIETFWVDYTLYFKPTTVNHILCGVYSVGSLVIMVAAILEIEMDKIRGYYDYMDFRNLEAGLWIFGGIVCAISQLYWAWELKSKNFLVMLAYIPAIVASILWMIARGVLGIDSVFERYVFGNDGELDLIIVDSKATDYVQLQADLMISASVLYIIHGLFWFGAVYETAKSHDFVAVENEEEEDAGKNDVDDVGEA